MKVVGILGGIASGKSHVCRLFEELGAVVIDADRIGHAVLEEGEVKRILRERWGAEVFRPDGTIDRARVALRVFAPSAAGEADRRFLEAVVHPRIAGHLRRKLAELGDAGSVPLVLLDAALLVEAGWRELCEEVVFVDCPEEQRRARALARGWTEGEWRAREAVQASIQEKRQVSTRTLDNSGSSAETMRQVQELWRRLTDIRPACSHASSDPNLFPDPT